MRKGHTPYIRSRSEKQDENRLRAYESANRARFDSSLRILLRFRPELLEEVEEFKNVRTEYVRRKCRLVKELHRFYIHAPVDIIPRRFGMSKKEEVEEEEDE